MKAKNVKKKKSWEMIFTSNFFSSLLDLTADECGGNCLRYKEQALVEEGSAVTILSIPESHWITHHSLKSPRTKDLTEIQAITAWFAHQKLMDNEQPTLERWIHHYLQLLPRNFDSMACQLSSALIDCLPADMILQIQQQDSNRKMDCQAIIESGCLGTINDNVLRWAWNCVNTRCFSLTAAPEYLKQTTTTPFNRPTIAVIPFLDFLNHSSTARFEPHFNSKTSSFEIVSLDSTLKGKEAFISYGNHDNHFLLVEYGFVEQGNPFNIVRLDHHVWPIVLKHLKLHNGTQQPPPLIIDTLSGWSIYNDYALVAATIDYEPLQKLVNALRLCGLYSTVQNSFNHFQLWQDVQYGIRDKVSSENEVLAMQLYKEILESALETTVNAVESVMSSHSHLPGSTSVAQILSEDRDILKKALHSL